MVVINCEKALTGKKLTDKIYYRHTGYPGGIKERVAGKVLRASTLSACWKKLSSG